MAGVWKVFTIKKEKGEGMNIYLVMQDENDDWDTYDSMVVYAETELEARLMHPDGYDWSDELDNWSALDPQWGPRIVRNHGWASHIKYVEAILLGSTNETIEECDEIILKSFNAG